MAERGRTQHIPERRAEEDWETDGRLLAGRLAEEAGPSVDLDSESRIGELSRITTSGLERLLLLHVKPS